MALVAEVALIAAVHWSAGPTYRVPLEGIVDWFSQAEPTVALVAAARVVALAIGYWLAATTILSALAHGLGWSALIDAMRWVTLPAIRRLAQGVTAMSLTGASLVGPAGLSASPALAQEEALVAQADDTTTDSQGEGTTGEDDGSFDPGPAGWPETEPGDSFWRPEPVTQPDPATRSDNQAPSRSITHEVVKGDHLWSISADRLRTVRGRAVTDDEIGRYWAKVVDANRSTIRSGDPDLIFPGEIITLPAV